jgi:hypothetical protein
MQATLMQDFELYVDPPAEGEVLSLFPAEQHDTTSEMLNSFGTLQRGACRF